MAFGREKVHFLNTPTPLEYLPSLSKELGIELYIKRDDLTNLGFGGNKLRKLEYVAAAALKQGATRLLTVGAAQSNHGRLTAAVAAKLGRKCTLAYVDTYPGELSSSLLLARMMGADVFFRKVDPERPVIEQYEAFAAELTAMHEAAGEKVYYTPMGASDELGMLGYYDCAVELSEQAAYMGIEDARVVCTLSSLGTYMGLFCGLKNEHSPLRLTGISIVPFGEAKLQRLMEYFQQVKDAYGLTMNASPEDFDIADYSFGAYNVPAKEAREAMYLMAQKEAIIVDPCYTGKTLAGIIDMVKTKKIAPGEQVIMIHTGGLPGIYSDKHRPLLEQDLLDGIYIMD